MAQATDTATLPGAMEQRRDELVSRIPSMDPSREYVASGLDIGLSQVIVSLPQYSDDLQREQGDAVYDRMMKDPAIFTAVQTLTEIVLMNGVRVETAVTNEEDPDYALARELTDFVSYNLKKLARPLTEVLTEMLNAFVYGACVAEKIYEMRITRKYGLRLHLKGIRPLARKNYSFVVDDWGNVQGFMARLPGQSSPQGYVDPSLVIEREKFAILAFGVTAGDPRGRSQIRSAYNAWWFKLQTYPRWLKYLQQFSTPSLIGYTPEGDDDLIELKDSNGRPLYNSDGSTKKITREQAMLTALVSFQAGSAIALKGGSKVEPIQSSGNGEAFVETIDAFNRELFLAILGNARANMEAKHGSKADSEGGQDTLSRKAEWLTGHIEEMLTRDVVAQLIALNWGDEIAERLTPTVTLKAADKEDRAKIMSAVASLWREKYFHKSQVAGLDRLIGAPERDMEAWLEEVQAEEDAAIETQRSLARVGDPLQGYQGGSGGGAGA
jgi:hypothetical protein